MRLVTERWVEQLIPPLSTLLTVPSPNCDDRCSQLLGSAQSLDKIFYPYLAQYKKRSAAQIELT